MAKLNIREDISGSSDHYHLRFFSFCRRNILQWVHGTMHSSRVILPAAFEVIEIDNLASLIGISYCSVSIHSLNYPSSFFEANMLERLIAHNDKIPLSPYVTSYISHVICLICHF